MRPLAPALCAFLFLSLPTWAQSAPQVAKALPIPRAEAVTSGPPATVGESANVVLRENDLFDLRMGGMPAEDAGQFSGSPYTVGSDGTVSILYAGKIRAAGRTPGELERAIEQELIAKKIFRWPNATINIVTSQRFVTIGGQVRAPSRMPWSPDLTLLSALMAAGGGSDFAGDKINLNRSGKVSPYSWKKLRKNPTQDPKLLPGDQIELQ
jgi:polysaccharide export outer membrane protein